MALEPKNFRSDAKQYIVGNCFNSTMYLDLLRIWTIVPARKLPVKDITEKGRARFS
jgi:hypothetical protein